MNDDQMTKEERDFATKWHNLIYTFLNDKNLPEEEFYDIVVFGYLRAVKQYFSKTELQKYSFSTIAWKKMDSSLIDLYKSNARQKRKGYTISLNTIICDDESLCFEDILPSPNPIMAQLEETLILHELATRISRQQMQAVAMKRAGYGVRDIAKSQKTSMKQVKALLDQVYATFVAVCQE